MVNKPLIRPYFWGGYVGGGGGGRLTSHEFFLCHPPPPLKKKNHLTKGDLPQVEGFQVSIRCKSQLASGEGHFRWVWSQCMQSQSTWQVRFGQKM